MAIENFNALLVFPPHIVSAVSHTGSHMYSSQNTVSTVIYTVVPSEEEKLHNAEL